MQVAARNREGDNLIFYDFFGCFAADIGNLLSRLRTPASWYIP